MTNIVVLAGHIGQPPETRQTQGGTKITRFSLATSRARYEDGKPLKDEEGRRVQDTEWHRITCFNGLAASVEQYCEKGMKLLVRGRIHYTKWTDAGGVERYGAEIIADSVDFLTRASRPAAQDMPQSSTPDLDDEIPF
jgi:single-strand DNA-binding protein